MDELRVVRREDGALIVATELGKEYRLVVDDALAAEVRGLTKRQPAQAAVRPREIQALLRSGKSRLEVAIEAGLEEADVERFEEPVRAEQRYILELAHAVPVRTDPAQPQDTPAVEQRFGEVIAERLIGLGNTTSEWRSWREEETGWLVGLAFDSRDGEHDAVWSFDHRKRVLSPLTPDATNLSKAGEVGDRLIPKLRVVESGRTERFEAEAFDPEALTQDTAPHAVQEQGAPSPDGADALDPDAEYARRRDIDHLAVKTTEADADDLSQTADLLDALRRRRGERALEHEAEERRGVESAAAKEQDGSAEPASTPSVPSPVIDEALPAAPAEPDTGRASSRAAEQRRGIARNIWGAAGVSAADRSAASEGRAQETQAADVSSGDSPAGAAPAPLRPVPQRAAEDDAAGQQQGAGPANSSASAGAGTGDAPAEPKSSKRGRSSIPSWDDILFGTRSDDDPA